jgi:decaprenyl-phosphate phosphoribosyltransferase
MSPPQPILPSVPRVQLPTSSALHPAAFPLVTSTPVSPVATPIAPPRRPAAAPRPPRLADFVRLARPRQWAKGAFVAVGPAYAIASGATPTVGMAIAVVGAIIAFGLASSACYIFNDIRDLAADRTHPRKRHRPIAAGVVPVPMAIRFALVMLVGAGLAALAALAGDGLATGAGLLALAVGVYVVNTTLYSLWLKHAVVLDVIALATGFVLRVLGGCAAAGVVPSTWLLNVVFFLSMFLAFGKRLGERRTMGDEASDARDVQSAYTDELLRMAVVVTAVATLITYAGYVQEQGERYLWGFNLLWLTMLPATYGLLRCIVLLERGEYDDPTELAARDRPFQLAVAVFGLITAVLVVGLH